MCWAILTLQGIVLGLLSDSGTITNHFMPAPHAAFPAIFFAAIIGVIVLIALSQVLLDPHA